MKSIQKKKKSIIAIDRSGDESNLPYVVVSVFSEERNELSKTYQKIKKLCINYKPILGYTGEIKSKEIKSRKLMKDIIELCLSENVIFSVSLFNKSIKGISKGIWKGKLKVESLIWFRSIEFLIHRNKIIPEQILMDINFTNTKDQSLFDQFIHDLVQNNFNFTAFVKGVDSRFEDGVKIADLIAGFIRKNTQIRKLYSNRITLIEKWI